MLKYINIFLPISPLIVFFVLVDTDDALVSSMSIKIINVYKNLNIINVYKNS